MNETIFSLAGTLTLVGWAGLAFAPIVPKLADRIAAAVIPAVLAVAYSGLIATGWAGAEGGFGTLAEVAALFRTPELLLAGWLHYLAFDLFVGAWEVRSARAAGMPHWLVLPALAATFLFGPAGFLLFLGLRTASVRFGAASAGPAAETAR